MHTHVLRNTKIEESLWMVPSTRETNALHECLTELSAIRHAVDLRKKSSTSQWNFFLLQTLS